MFGGSLDPPKHVKHTRPKPMVYDIQLPMPSHPGAYAHMGRRPNTDYHVQHLHYKQRMNYAHIHVLAEDRKRLLKDAALARYDKHAEKATLKSHIQERFHEKVKAYEEAVDRRRAKLRELLCREEQEQIQETIEQAQKGVDNKMQEMKIKAQQLKAQREEERLAVVKEKRMLQYIESCTELRPELVKQNLLDTKKTQLEQIRENEMKKEAERELEAMWYDLMKKESEAKMEREVQTMLKYGQQMKETLDTWDKQIQGKKLLMEEKERIAAEDRLEMIKLEEQIRREKIEALDDKRRKRDKIAEELKQQIAIQEKVAAERKREEDALNDAFNRLAEVELEKERQKVKNITAIAKRETAIYRKHLKELDEERKQEEKHLHALLEEHRKMIEKKQQDAYCKFKEAREKLMQDVLAGRAQQLEYKRQEAENQLKMKEAENELLRMACETNERLQAEHDRLLAEKVKEYRDDLKKQIDELNDKRRLVKEELKKELAEGLAEEERQRQHVLEIIQARLSDEGYKHPFRKVIDRSKCPCAENMNK